MTIKDRLVDEIELIIATLDQIVFHYGETFKLPIEEDDEQAMKEMREMYEQHFKFLGAVGLVNEYTINNTNVSVTVSPHILGFYVAFVDEIEFIGDHPTNEENSEHVIKLFKKMFPQEKEHCSNCCPELEEDEDE